MTLERRTPLRRTGGPLARSQLARSGPLRPESDKRIRERPIRANVRKETIMRAGGRCEAIDLVPEVPCWSPERGPDGGPRLDVDEITARGTNPGSHLNAKLTQCLCRAHHQWKDAYPAEAERRGLRVRGNATTRRRLDDDLT